jgi:cytochrome c2
MRGRLGLLVLLAGLSGCGQSTREHEPAQAERARGRMLLAAYGCIACHQIKGMNAPERSVGPSLEHIARNSYIGGILPNNGDALARWIVEPRRISPGTAMPDLGVSADEARAMTAYLYSQ